TPESSLYFDYVFAAMSATALSSLEEIMTVSDDEFRTELIGRPFREGRAEGREKGRAEGREKGRAEGRAQAILDVLEARGISVPDETRERITTSSDLDELGLWVRRAATMDRVEELFDGARAPTAAPWPPWGWRSWSGARPGRNCESHVDLCRLALRTP